MSRTIPSQDFANTLAQYGIGHLTAEACNYGLRIRYELSEFGLKVFEQALGIDIDRSTQMRSMNSTVYVRGEARDDQAPALYGVMMTSRQAYDVLLFALVNDSLNEVVIPFKAKATRPNEHYYAMPFIWIGTLTEWVDFKEELIEGGANWFIGENMEFDVYRNDAAHPSEGGLNVHKFTGRTR